MIKQNPQRVQLTFRHHFYYFYNGIVLFLYEINGVLIYYSYCCNNCQFKLRNDGCLLFWNCIDNYTDSRVARHPLTFHNLIFPEIASALEENACMNDLMMSLKCLESFQYDFQNCMQLRFKSQNCIRFRNCITNYI